MTTNVSFCFSAVMLLSQASQAEKGRCTGVEVVSVSFSNSVISIGYEYIVSYKKRFGVGE